MAFVKTKVLVASLVAILASLVMAASASAIGDTVQVTINSDSGSSSGCELRDAITAVETGPTTVGGCTSVDVNGTADHVTFSSAMSGQTITLNGVDPLTINDTESDLSIEGPGMNQLTISGADADRVFNVQTFTSMTGLSVVHGACCGGFSPAQGGAIFATAILDLTDVKVADSAVSASKSSGTVFADGGGIYINGGTLNLNQSIVTGNSVAATNTGTGSDSAQAQGGGIFANGVSMQINGSTISDNTGDASADDADATSIADATAGIWSNEHVEMTQSTISGNVANSSSTNGTANARGALYEAGGTATSVDQSTIAGNQADNTQNGAGVLAGGLDIANDMDITGSTIALNGPINTGDNIDGANIFLEAGTNTVEDTIIADPRGGGENCAGPGGITSNGFSDDHSSPGPSCFPISGGTDVASDPLLATAGLAPNGGLTQTIALQPTSPMIDQGLGANLGDPTVDQRGFTRPVDFSSLPDAAGGDASDIGAFEVQQACAGFVQPTPSTPCPSSPSPTPTASPTGQRAAALSK